MLSTAFSTSSWKLKRRVRIFQDISETDNPNLNFFQIIILHEKTKNRPILYLKKVDMS